MRIRALLLGRVDHDPIRLISFGGDSTEPPAPEKVIGDAMVDEGTEASKPYQMSTWSLGVVLRSLLSPLNATLLIFFFHNISLSGLYVGETYGDRSTTPRDESTRQKTKYEGPHHIV